MQRRGFSFIFKLVVAIIAVAAIYHFGFSGHATQVAEKDQTEDTGKNNNTTAAEGTVELTAEQLNAIHIAPVESRSFRIEKEEVGSVAYHEQGLSPDAERQGKPVFVIANVLESDSPFIHVGQPVNVKILVYPDRVFDGKVSVLGVTAYDSGGNPALDPGTHRITVRCEVVDPKNELYPGMLATVTFQLHPPEDSPAIPENGVVREGDGTMSAWVTTDHHRFARRIVKTGIRQDGYVQILEGVQPGEQAVTDGAVFLSNMLFALPSE